MYAWRKILALLRDAVAAIYKPTSCNLRPILSWCFSLALHSSFVIASYLFLVNILYADAIIVADKVDHLFPGNFPYSLFIVSKR